jgi:hypothetical protein
MDWKLSKRLRRKRSKLWVRLCEDHCESRPAHDELVSSIIAQPCRRSAHIKCGLGDIWSRLEKLKASSATERDARREAKKRKCRDRSRHTLLTTLIAPFGHLLTLQKSSYRSPSPARTSQEGLSSGVEKVGCPACAAQHYYDASILGRQRKVSASFFPHWCPPHPPLSSTPLRSYCTYFR